LGSACTTKSLDVEASAPSTAPRPTVAERRETSSTTTSAVPPSSDTTMDAPASSEGGGGMAAGEPGSRAGQCPSDEELLAAAGDSASMLPTPDGMRRVLDLIGTYVPPALAADFQMMRVASEQLIAALEAVGPDSSALTPAQMEQYEAALEAMSAPGLEEASQRVDAYFSEVCPDLGWLGEDFDQIGPAFD
jgi:hypothetical protein